MSDMGTGAARATRNFMVTLAACAFAASGSVALAQTEPALESASEVAAPAELAATRVITAPADTPQAQAVREIMLPANTEIVLGTVEELNSKTAKLGDKVKLITLSDVVVDGATVIPKGTAGEGVVTYHKGKGSFGKSGKLELAFTSLDLSGKPLALTGKYQDQGKGNTGGTVAAVVGFGLIGGALVTGHSASIMPGEEMRGNTVEATTITAAFGQLAAAPAAPVEAVAAASAAPVEAPKE